MSKSYDNYIALDDSAEDMYGKIMSINDSMIEKYYKLAIFAEKKKVLEVKSLLKDDSINPRDIKKDLAKALVEKYYDENAAEKAEKSFEKVFVKRDNPDDMPEALLSSEKSLIDLLLGENLISSKGEGKRLIAQKAIKISGEICDDPNKLLSSKDNGAIIKVGKRRFLKIVSS